MDGLSLYWNPSSDIVSDKAQTDILCSMGSLDSKWSIVHNFELKLNVQGHLSRIEDRRRDLSSCLCDISLPDVISDRLLAIPFAELSSCDELLSRLSLSKEEHEKVGERIHKLWELLKTPLPLLCIDFCVGSLNFKFAKSQMNHLIEVFSSFSSTSDTSDSESPSIKEESTVTKVINENQEGSSNQESCDIYTFGVIPCILYVINCIFSYSSLWYYIVGVFVSFPLLFMRPFLYLTMFLPIVLLIIWDAIYLYFYYKRLNRSVDKTLHSNEQYASVSLQWDGFHGTVIDDQKTPEIIPLSVHILPVKASIGIGKNAQIVHCIAEGLTVVDGVASLRKSRDCYVLCSSPISHYGEVLPSKVPLMDADIRLDHQVLDLSVALGDLNVIFSPMLIHSLIEFLPSQLLKGNSAKTAQSTRDSTPAEQSLNKKEGPKTSIHFSASFSSIGLLLDTDASYPLCHCVLSSFTVSGNLASSLSLSFSLGDAQVIDVTHGAGEYSSVVSLVSKDSQPFIKGCIDMAVSLAISCDIGEIVIALRMRFVREVISYLTRGSLPLLLSLVQSITSTSSQTLSDSSIDSLSDTSSVYDTVSAPNSASMTANVSIAGFSLILPKLSESRDKCVLSSGNISVHLGDCIDVSLASLQGFSELKGAVYTFLASCDFAFHLIDMQKMKMKLAVSPILFMISESNLMNLVTLLASNLEENGFLADLLSSPTIESSSSCPPPDSSVAAQHSDSLLDLCVEFDGFGLLFASSDDALHGYHNGQVLMDSSLDIPGCLFFFSLRNLYVSCFVCGSNTHIACSLESFGLKDVRNNSSLYSSFKSLLCGGSKQKPFLSLLMDLSSDEAVNCTDLSVRVGTISLIPTSFLFSLLDGVLSCVQHLLSTVKTLDMNALLPIDLSEQKAVEETVTRSSLQKVHVVLSLEGLSVGVVENPEIHNSPVFLLRIGANGTVDISPSMEVNLSASLIDIRACRTNDKLVLPPTDMSDVLAPFSVNISLAQKSPTTDIAASITPLCLRLGVPDITLFTNFLTHFIPQEGIHFEKYSGTQPIDQDTSAPAAASPSPYFTNLSLSCPEISLLLVNDRFEFELPVLQFSIRDIAASASLGSALTLHTSICLSGDYYKQCASVWEPYLERWVLSVDVGQRETAHSSIFKSTPSTMFVSVEAEKPLFLNVTSSLLASFSKVVDYIQECSESSPARGERCYVAVENRTGYPMIVRVIEDGGLNHDLLSAAKNKQMGARDDILWEGLVSTACSTSHRWMEIHTASPVVRVFDSIPLDGVEPSVAVNEMSRSELVFTLSPETIVCAKSKQQGDYWQQCIGQKQDSVVPLGIPSITDDNINREISVLSDTVVSPLPAHPSMSLRFVGLPYHHLPQRVLSLCVQGFEPIRCVVDSERDVFVPLVDQTGHEQHAILHNEVRDGRKVISLTSTICVENQTDLEISTFYSSLEWTGEPVILKKNCSHYCPLSIVENAALHLSVTDYGSSEVLSLRKLSKGHIPSSLNIGSALNPCFVRLVLHRSSLYDTLTRRFVETYRICLVPMLRFVNMLPVPLECRVVYGDTIVREDSLCEGKSFVLHESNVNPSLKKQEQILRIRVRPKDSVTFSLFDESVIPSLGSNQSCLVYDDHNLFLRLSYDVSLSREGVVMIQIFADFWIINRTNEDLIISEKKDSSSDYRKVPAQATSFTPLSLFDASSVHSLQPFLYSCSKPDPSVSFFIRTSTSQWSEKLGIGAVGTTGVTALHPDDKSKDTMLKVFGLSINSAPSIFGLSKVVTISASIVIFNATGSSLRMRQVQTDTPMLIEPNVPMIFHWPNHSAPLEVEFEKSDETWTDACKFEVGESLHLFDDSIPHVLRVSCVMEMEHLSVVIDYAGKFNTDLFIQQVEYPDEVIDYHQLLQNEMTPVEQQSLSLHLSVNLQGIGISVIDSVPREVLFCTLQNLCASLDISDKGTIVLTSSITKFQIDNSLSNSQYPVVLGSLNAGDQEGDSVQHVLTVSLMMSRHPSVLVLDYLGVLLLPLSISIDSPMVTALCGVMNDLPMISSQAESVTGREILIHCPLLCSCLPFVNVVTSQYCYLQELLLQPISVKISVHNDPSAPLTADLLPAVTWLLPFKAVLNTVISLVANLNNATLQLDSFAMDDTYLSFSTLAGKLVSHYLKQVINKLYLLLGAFNLLGNPVELVGNISEGVRAMFFEPVSTLLKQPNEFVGSVGKGTSKLVSMTAYGVLDSVSKITGTVTNGIASLNMSQSYQADRAAGKSGILHGITSGVKGLYKDTTSGFREGGFKGLAKGLGTGLAGVVLNPVTGTIESVTNVVNDAKNRIHEEKTLQRIRQPRSIPLDGYLLPYDAYPAEGAALLAIANRSSSLDLDRHERYVYHIPIDDGARVLLLTTSRLMILSSKGRMERSARLDKVEVKQDGARLDIQVIGKQKTIQKDGLLLQSEEVATMVAEALRMIPVSTYESIAAYIRHLLENIHPQQLVEETLPSIDTLVIESVTYVSRTVMRAGESYNEDEKRQHIMYKVEVCGGEVIWNVYFRYTKLE